MSIVRVGLAENEKFASGYDAIFGNKKKSTASKAAKPKTAKARASKSTAKARKKTTAKKKK